MTEKGTMRAVAISQPGGPDVLQLVERPVPTAGTGELLIAVAAAGVNRPDVLQRIGHYAPPPGTSDLPGLEVAGTVIAVGPEVSGWHAGDQVCALLAGGGYAERAVAPAVQCLPLPERLSLVEAAAIPETFFTVWTNVMERGGLEEGEAFLVHGGSSGIGTTAIQLARAFGAVVFATAGSDDKCRACEALGAERGINYRTEDFVAVTKDATGGQGIDLILDMVGGDYLQRNLEALAVEGRLVQIAFLQGATPPVDLRLIMQKRLTLTGSTLRPRTPTQKGAIAAALREHVWPLVERRLVLPQIHATFPLEAAADAHRLLESSTHMGKIVLIVGASARSLES